MPGWLIRELGQPKPSRRKANEPARNSPGPAGRHAREVRRVRKQLTAPVIRQPGHNN